APRALDLGVQFPVAFGAAQIEGRPDALTHPALTVQPLYDAILRIALDGQFHQRVTLAAGAVGHRWVSRHALGLAGGLGGGLDTHALLSFGLVLVANLVGVTRDVMLARLASRGLDIKPGEANDLSSKVLGVTITGLGEYPHPGGLAGLCFGLGLVAIGMV